MDPDSRRRAGGMGRRLVRLLVVVLLMLGSFTYGYLVHQRELPPYRSLVTTFYELRENPTVRRLYFQLVGRSERGGVWGQRRSQGGLDAAQKARQRQLQAIGYLGAVEAAPDASGTTYYVPELAQPGLNLYTSGDAPEAILMDMRGKVLHRWRKSFASAFPDVPPPPPGTLGVDHWRYAHLFDNGDLLAIFDGHGIVKLDRDSRLIWARANHAHHDLEVTDEGEIYVLTREWGTVPAIHPWKPVLEDFITVLGPDGEERRRYSTVEAFHGSRYASVLRFARDEGDVFHTNTLEILDGSDEPTNPAFAAGHALISLNNLNLAAVIDPERNEVVWILTGLSRGLHDPTFVGDAHLLMLDNRGHRGFSKVIEVDTSTQQIVWGYYGDEQNGFSTEVSGSNRRLANGNTLITESTGGRAFEVTLDGTVVWEYYNPRRAGPDQSLIATILAMQRIESERVAGWLEVPDESLPP